MRSLAVAIGMLFVCVGGVSDCAADGWLDNDPNAIWRRSPGFYHEGEDWYAIIHVRPGVTCVRLAGDFTDWQDAAAELTRTPDSKFWWFKGTASAFTRPPAAGDKYLVVMNFKGNSWQRYNVGRSGRYREVANTSWPAFNLGGHVERTRGGDDAHQISDVPLPAYGVVVLRRE